MKIDCPHCGVHGSVEDELAGKKLRCPKCSKVFLIPEELLPEIDDVGIIHQETVSDERAESPVVEESIEAAVTEEVTAAEGVEELPDAEEELAADSDEIPVEVLLQKCSACGQSFAEEFLVEVDSRLYCSLCEPGSGEEQEAAGEEESFAMEESAEELEEDVEDVLVDDEGGALEGEEEPSEMATCDKCGESLNVQFLETVGEKRYCALCLPEGEGMDVDFEDEDEDIDVIVEETEYEDIEEAEDSLDSARTLLADEDKEDEEEYDEHGFLKQACSECGEKFHPDFLQQIDGKMYCGVCQPEVLEVVSDEDGGGEGELEEGLQGSDFTIGEVLKEAWQKTKGAKGAIWGGVIVMYGILFGLGFATLYGLQGVYVVPDPSTTMGTSTAMGLNIGLQLISSLLSVIFTAGIMWIGVKRALQQRISWKMVFSGFSRFISLTMVAVLQTIMIVIGFCLLIIPGIYLAVGYALALPLVMEKGYGPWQALEASRKVIHKKWWSVFGLYLVMFIIYAVSAIPLGLGLIWTVPMFFLCIGVLYRRLFATSEGDGEDAEDAEEADEEADEETDAVDESEDIEKE